MARGPLLLDDIYDVPGLEERFWASVSKADGCWLWQRGHEEQGYGIVHIRLRSGSYRSMHAHRIAYLLTHGVIPAGTIVLHSCDMPACVNPAHLDCGSHSDNMADMVRKGRKRGGCKPGEAHQDALLSATEVRAIRTRYRCGGISQRALAADYGVARWTIQDVLSGKNWGSVATECA